MKIVELFPELRDQQLKEVLSIVDQAFDELLLDGDYKKVYLKLYHVVNGGHYNDELAEEQISHMWFDDGKRVVKAPFFTDSEASPYYDKVSKQVNSKYTAGDIKVAFNMVYSDNYNLLHKWFPEATKEELLDKVTDMTVNWINDPDWDGTERVWEYFNK